MLDSCLDFGLIEGLADLLVDPSKLFYEKSLSSCLNTYSCFLNLGFDLLLLLVFPLCVYMESSTYIPRFSKATDRAFESFYILKILEPLL
jgi:hypothetical protein